MEDNKLFIDINIILDILDDKRISHNSSKKFMQTCLSDDITMAISDDIITTVYYIAQKTVERNTLLEFINFLNKNFIILSFDNHVIDEAIKNCLENSTYDFEDILQAFCAKRNNYKTIITNDKRFPKIDGIKLIQTYLI